MPNQLFTALWPDAATRAALAADLDRIRSQASDVRWQPAHRWHITLAFLGPRDPAKAAARIDRLVASDPLPAPEPVRIVGSGTFGPVVWSGVEHGPWLASTAGFLQRALHTDDRRFRAHLTVGRVRGPHAPGRARDVAALLATSSGPLWTPHDVTLVESVGGPRPEYRVLRAWPLQSPPR